MSKRISVIIDDREVENLNVLLGKYGGRAPEYFRSLLKEAYKQEFGGYKSGRSRSILDVPEDQLTDEQFCEKCTGRVMTREDGGKVCALRIGDSMYKIPLTNREGIEGMAKKLKLI